MTDRRVALLTGAAGGIGLATARRLAADGLSVVLTDVDGEGLGRAAASIPGAVAITADLAVPSECRRVVAAAVAAAGRLDVLVNAAGVWREGPFEDLSDDDLDVVLAVNVRAVAVTTSAAIPHLKATEGLIVNLSSDAGIQGNNGAALYCASKGAVSLMTKALALELAPDGVRVNAVCPGDTDTPMLAFQARRYGGGDEDAYRRRLLSGYPQGDRARFVRAEEVAALIAFLAGPDAGPITGALLPVDFGYSAGR